MQAYLSNASRYFCFRISKNIFIEYRLSSTLVKPERYFSTSSQLPLCTSSSKYFMLKKNPDSCSSLFLFIYFHITLHQKITNNQSSLKILAIIVKVKIKNLKFLLMNSLFELLLIQELQDQENELSTERRHLKRPVLYTKCRNTTNCSPRSAATTMFSKKNEKKNPKTGPKLGI